jgi:hypothetical protein
MNKLFHTTIISKFPEKDKEIRTKWWYWLPVGASFMVCLIGIAVLGYIVAGIPDRLEYYAEPVELKAEPIRQIVEVIPIEIEVVEEDPEPIPEPTVHMTDDDIIAAVVMSEAGNQDLLGKTAVAATILNRADYFDLTIEQVVNAENAYSYPYYGVITAECYRAVEIARENRDLFPATMMYFRTGDYHSFGEHYNKIGDHFFSMIESEG